MPKRGGKRTKRRTHVATSEEADAAAEAASAPIPRSMVIRAPKTVLPHALQLLQTELRKVMAPHTAAKLKERKNNSLKDYTHVAALLKVTHLLLLAPGGTKRSHKQPEDEGGGGGGLGTAEVVNGAGALLKIGRLPQGPTLSFRVERYSLCRHVRATLKRSYDSPALYDAPPLVVLNNFAGASSPTEQTASGQTVACPAHLKLMRITFQNMFPPLDVATVKLADCRRVVLFHYDAAKEVVEVRHLAVRAQPVAVSKPVKRVLHAQLPDLGHLDDISDWLLGQAGVAGDASDSEAEEDSQVVLPQRMAGRGNHGGQRSAVKLAELGPRLSLKLFKVERGLCEGDVMYHGLEKRSAAEVAAQRSAKAKETNAKRQRREQQESNVARKAAVEEEKRAAKRARREAREAVREAAAEAEARGGAAPQDEGMGEADDEDDEEEEGGSGDEGSEDGE